jgi:hypothetical protein
LWVNTFLENLFQRTTTPAEIITAAGNGIGLPLKIPGWRQLCFHHCRFCFQPESLAMQ